MRLNFFKLNFDQLLKYGVHIGHSFINSWFYSGWLVYSYKKNIVIINLLKSVWLFKTGFRCLDSACYLKGPIWFISLDKSISAFINHAANICGEFGWTSKWVHGIISNYITLYDVYRTLQKYSQNAYKKKQLWVVENQNNWLFSRFSWPRAVFLPVAHGSYTPAKECIYLGIPCLGVVDTDTYSHVIGNPIPGNDDSLDCIALYNDIISNYIIFKKYHLISSWFHLIRSGNRINNFYTWYKHLLIEDDNKSEKELKKIFEESLKRKVNLFYDYFVNRPVDVSNLYCKSLSLYFSKNFWLNRDKKQLDIHYSNKVNAKAIYYSFLNNKYKLFKLLILERMKRSWSIDFYLKEKRLKSFYFFRRNFLRRKHYFFHRLFKNNFFFLLRSRKCRDPYLSINFKQFLKFYLLNLFLKHRILNKFVNKFDMNSFYLKYIHKFYAIKYKNNFIDVNNIRTKNNAVFKFQKKKLFRIHKFNHVSLLRKIRYNRRLNKFRKR